MTTSQLAAGYCKFSFYGDVDFIPTDQYDEADAVRAFGYARQATAALEKVLKGLNPPA